MTELSLRVNGIEAAFGIEFGLSSPGADEGRAGDPYRQANVSYSLVQRSEGQVIGDLLDENRLRGSRIAVRWRRLACGEASGRLL